jgi:predicted O-methyltransferase YrrM
MRIQTPQQKYVNDVFGLDDRELLAVREELHRQNLDFMSISASEARILQFFVRATGVRKIVEVGMLFGYSALAMAKALPEDGVLWSLEKNPENFRISKGFFDKFADGRKVRPLLGDGLENLKSIESEGPFDLVFIDADKGNYANYLSWAERNVRRGGYIVGDNTFLWGGVWDQPSESDITEKSIKAMKEFNLRLSDPSKYNSTIIPTAEGMTIAQKL